MAINGRTTEYFPPLSQPQDGNLSTTRRPNLQTLRHRQRQDISLVRRGAIRRPAQARPVRVAINNVARHTGTGLPQPSAALDGADESKEHETQPSAVAVVGSDTKTDPQGPVQKPKLDNNTVAERPTTAESLPAQSGRRGMFKRLSRLISGLWS